MNPALNATAEITTTEPWKQALAQAITSPEELLRLLELESSLSDRIIKHPDFRCLVPHAYLKKIQPGNFEDPLLKQVLPTVQENIPGGFKDPVGDLDAMPVDGLLHKYQGRALLVTTGACAIHCRYCFRQHYPYTSNTCKPSQIKATLDYLRQHPEIDEIILSGGDPLTLDDSRLSTLITHLHGIPTLKNLRIHTRLPVILPLRITPALLAMLENSRFRVTMVIHANHANEITNDEITILKQLHQAGITLLNQSVLLKGINDTTESLVALSKQLHAAYTQPYYLHLLDPVQGALHFDRNEQDAVKLVTEMQKQLPGYLIPRLVREIRGKPSKTAVFSI